MTTTPELTEAVLEQAIEWAIKVNFNQPDAKTRSAFDRWLAASAEHEAAWQRISGVQESFKKLPGALAMGVLDSAEKSRSAGRNRRRSTLKFLLLTVTVGSVSWMVREHTSWQRLVSDESTAVGVLRTIHLADGTLITLNTDTAISIDLSGDRRQVTVHRGEISVTTGADAEFFTRTGNKRSFWVNTPFGTLQALGTRFIVRLETDRARISVQEGAVEMTPARGGSPVIVKPGLSWWLSDTGSEQAKATGIGIADWEDGLIVADDVRMDDFIAELARYRPGIITCEKEVAALRVSGFYHVADTDRTLRFLASTQPVDIAYRTRYWLRVVARQVN